MNPSWSDDESFWTAMEPALCAPARLALAETDVPKIIAIAGVTEKSSILDLACGPGAHAVEFAKRGYAVTGVDRSSRYVGPRPSAAGRRGRQTYTTGDLFGSFDANA